MSAGDGSWYQARAIGNALGQACWEVVQCEQWTGACFEIAQESGRGKTRALMKCDRPSVDPETAGRLTLTPNDQTYCHTSLGPDPARVPDSPPSLSGGVLKCLCTRYPGVLLLCRPPAYLRGS